MKNVVKEFIFGVLFLVVVIMIIGILFYEFIPTKVTPESAKYAQNQTTESLISEIEKEQDATQTSVFKTYELAKADVEIPETTTDNTEYDQGKNNPFYDYTSENQATSNTESVADQEQNNNQDVTNNQETNTEENENQSISSSSQTSNLAETNKPSTVETSSDNNDSAPVNTNNLRDTSSSTKTTK